MQTNPLPPQAYTKDTLLRAYHWVQAQSPHIKELALTPDILVSLYLKSVRDGDQSLERPSIQNFKTELKSLAGMMGELERPEAPAPKKAAPAPRAPSAQPKEAPAAPLLEASFSIPAFDSGLTQDLALDAHSLEIVREAQRMFNLSSEQEACRMLLQIGFTKAKGFIAAP